MKGAGGDPVGYDLNFVLDKGATDRPELAARVTEPKSGRTLEVYTNFLEITSLPTAEYYQYESAYLDTFCFSL